MPEDFNLSCPVPIDRHDTVQMAHGGGGRLMQRLIDDLFIAAFSGTADAKTRLPLHDSTVLDAGGARVAFTTDTFVVNPLFFPGGDIGKLAVCGTVNDLAMSGADPKWLSAGFILSQEGFPIEALGGGIVQSMPKTAEAAGRADCDRRYEGRLIAARATACSSTPRGSASFPTESTISPHGSSLGDVVMVSGDLGRPALPSCRSARGSSSKGPLESDCDSLGDLVAPCAAWAAICTVCGTDARRAAAALNEIAGAAQVGVELEDMRQFPWRHHMAGACEMLGLGSVLRSQRRSAGPAMVAV